MSEKNIVAEYQAFYDLPACFGTGDRQKDKETYWATGFASQQDDLAISFSRIELADKMKILAESTSFKELQSKFRICTTDQWDYKEAKDFIRAGNWGPYVGQVCYRPFDRRWSVMHKHILTILRRKVMSQIGGDARYIGLICSRAVNDLKFAHCFVAENPVDKIAISSKTSTNAYVFPLYFQSSDMYGERRGSNFSRSFIRTLAEGLRIANLDRATGLPSGVSPEDVFNYIYAVLFSPTYRARYAELLKGDFPRVPVARSLKLFRNLSGIGSTLVGLHLMRSPTLDNLVTTYVGPKNPKVQRVGWSGDAVWLDAGMERKNQVASSGTAGFVGVTEAVWGFHIGGYQVCEKWLKDRKGRNLSAEEIRHYQKVIVVLSETIRLMGEIDEVIEAHGGWPDAFVSAGVGA
jgi:hypothetical protein